MKRTILSKQATRHEAHFIIRLTAFPSFMPMVLLFSWFYFAKKNTFMYSSTILTKVMRAISREPNAMEPR